MALIRPRLSVPVIASLARAAVELAVARGRLKVRGFDAVPRELASPTTPLSPTATALVDRIAFALPRVAARMPWRADCLVQALAAQRWLGAKGITSTIRLGAPRHLGARFEAHAWLTVGDRIVTGGDQVDGYVPFDRTAG